MLMFELTSVEFFQNGTSTSPLNADKIISREMNWRKIKMCMELEQNKPDIFLSTFHRIVLRLFKKKTRRFIKNKYLTKAAESKHICGDVNNYFK